MRLEAGGVGVWGQSHHQAPITDSHWVIVAEGQGCLQWDEHVALAVNRLTPRQAAVGVATLTEAPGCSCCPAPHIPALKTAVSEPNQHTCQQLTEACPLPPPSCFPSLPACPLPSFSSRVLLLLLQSIMFNQPAVLHAFLEHLTNALITYCCYQIEAGAQVVQLFDSWAHHLSPQQFAEFSLPYANRVVEGVRAKHPHVPLIYHANGGEALGAGGR